MDGEEEEGEKTQDQDDVKYGDYEIKSWQRTEIIADVSGVSSISTRGSGK